MLKDINYRDDIQELSAMKQISNLLVNKLDLLLNHMTEFDSIKDFKLIDSRKIKYTKLIINYIFTVKKQ